MALAVHSQRRPLVRGRPDLSRRCRKLEPVRAAPEPHFVLADAAILFGDRDEICLNADAAARRP